MCLPTMSQARMAGGRRPTKTKLREYTHLSHHQAPKSSILHTRRTTHSPFRKAQLSGLRFHPRSCHGWLADWLTGWLAAFLVVCCSTKQRAEHVHHDFFDVWSSHVRDLKEFGVGECANTASVYCTAVRTVLQRVRYYMHPQYTGKAGHGHGGEDAAA